MRKLSKSVHVALVTGSLVIGSLAFAGPIAQAATNAPRVNAAWTDYRGINKTSKGDHSGDWVHCDYVTKAAYTQPASCSQGKSVSLSISETYGYSDGEISASVGFSVSYTSSVTATNGVNVAPGGSGWFDVGFRYHGYTIDMQKRTCHTVGGCTAWTDSHTIVVQQHLGPTGHYFGTGAIK